MGGRTEKGNLERKRVCLFVLPTPPQSARPSVRLMHIRPLPGEGSEGQAGFISSRHRKEREPVGLRNGRRELQPKGPMGLTLSCSFGSERK